MDAAIEAEQLGYAEQATAFALQGILNKAGGPPTMMFDAGFEDFDWPAADPYVQRETLFAGRAHVADALPSLCCVDILGPSPAMLPANAACNGRKRGAWRVCVRVGKVGVRLPPASG